MIRTWCRDFFLKISLMTITQHALLYNFHTSNLIFEETCFLKFLSMQPPVKVWYICIWMYVFGGAGWYIGLLHTQEYQGSPLLYVWYSSSYYLNPFTPPLTKKFCDPRTPSYFVVESTCRKSHTATFDFSIKLKLIASPLDQTNRYLSVFSDDIFSLGVKLVGATLTYH